MRTTVMGRITKIYRTPRRMTGVLTVEEVDAQMYQTLNPSRCNPMIWTCVHHFVSFEISFHLRFHVIWICLRLFQVSIEWSRTVRPSISGGRDGWDGYLCLTVCSEYLTVLITAQAHKWRRLTFLRSSNFWKHFKGPPFPIACNFRQEWEVCWKVCIKRWPDVHLSVRAHYPAFVLGGKSLMRPALGAVLAGIGFCIKSLGKITRRGFWILKLLGKLHKPPSSSTQAV